MPLICKCWGTCAIGNLGKERAGSLDGLVAGSFLPFHEWEWVVALPQFWLKPTYLAAQNPLISFSNHLRYLTRWGFTGLPDVMNLIIPSWTNFWPVHWGAEFIVGGCATTWSTWRAQFFICSCRVRHKLHRQHSSTPKLVTNWKCVWTSWLVSMATCLFCTHSSEQTLFYLVLVQLLTVRSVFMPFEVCYLQCGKWTSPHP